jgi:hypothetical protein
MKQKIDRAGYQVMVCPMQGGNGANAVSPALKYRLQGMEMGLGKDYMLISGI